VTTTTDTTDPLDLDRITRFAATEVVHRELVIELDEGGPTISPAHGGFTLVAHRIVIHYIREETWRLASVTVSGPPANDLDSNPMIYAGTDRIIDFRAVTEFRHILWLAKLVNDYWPAEESATPMSVIPIEHG